MFHNINNVTTPIKLHCLSNDEKVTHRYFDLLNVSFLLLGVFFFSFAIFESFLNGTSYQYFYCLALSCRLESNVETHRSIFSNFERCLGVNVAMVLTYIHVHNSLWK